MKVLVAQFHGINCDYDVRTWARTQGHQAEFIWQTETSVPKGTDLVVIPGGFSYGDYLRCGALAARSSLMRAVQDYAKSGGSVLGICNGFQILCEAQLLPGALLANHQGHYIDQWVDLKVHSKTSVFQSAKTEICIPIAHGEGRYFAEAEEVLKMQDQNQIWMTYKKDVNGSLDQIAGVSSKDGKICGMMPHPERAFMDWMESTDGNLFL